MKKTLALVLALAMVFSTITVAFAEGTLGADAQTCANLGMLKGETGTVDAAYVATAPTRLQAAIMFLRLKGLEAEALAFTGADNFADATDVNWAGGKAIMAYLKANPQLGWQGDAGKLNPNNKITAQEYYKVMLEALGYKQSTPEVVGDFAWADVFTFAASVGLSKVATVTNFTVNDVATATVEALKLNVKGGTTSLATTLVEAGKMDKAAAIAAGLYADVATTTAKLDAVIGTANDKVEVTFDAEVAAAFAENAANYKIVVKGSTTELAVTAAKAVGTTMAELTTAAQVGGTAYTMTVGDVSKNFAGIAKSTAVPEIDTVKCIDTNTVEVVFKKAMDRASVEDVANYALDNNATVKSAELWIDQDDSRKTVKLTTENIVKNKIYKLTVSNVKSADMVAIKNVTKSFAGITDTVAPKVKGNVVVLNNQRFIVVFEDSHGIDKATAENISNWTIDGLTITSIKAKDYKEYGNSLYGLKDDYSYLDVVEVDTEPMTPSKKYTITVSNLADGSAAKNTVAKALTKTFYGVAVDKTAPTAGVITTVGDSMVEIQYRDSNRLDVASATDVNNYTFNEGLQVLSASILRDSDLDNGLGKTVILKTSTMDEDTTYKITIENVADEFGNVISKVSNRSLRRSDGPDIAPPAISKVVWTSKTELSVYFVDAARLDAESANDPSNYVINNEIGAVKKAELSSKSGYLRVDLTTPELTANKNYKLTINGVKDRLGNAISNLTVTFSSGMTSIDNDRPEIENTVTLNKNEIRVTFNEAVNATAGSTMHFYLKSDAAKTDITATAKGLAVPNYTIDDNTTVVFQTAGLGANDEYVITGITNITDKHNNNFAVVVGDEPTFYGNTDNNDDTEVIAVDQVTTKKLTVTFSEPVLVTGPIGTWTVAIDPDDDETTEALSIVTLTRASNIPDGTELSFDFRNVTDYVGKACTEAAYKYTPYLVDEDDPTIDYVEAVHTGKVQVHFNEDLTSAGSYNIKGYFGSSTTETTKSVNGVLDVDDKDIVNLNVTGLGMNAGEVYTLTPKTSAVDIAGNSLDREDVSYDFVASAVVVYDYIKGVRVIDAKTLKVEFTSAQTSPATTISVKADIDNPVEMFSTLDLTTNGTKTWIINLNTPILDGIDYIVDTNVHDQYTFAGLAGDGGLSVDTDEVIEFSGFNSTDFVVKVVYGTAPAATIAYNAVAVPVAGPLVAEVVGFDASRELDALGVGATYLYTIEVYRAGEAAVLYSKDFTR